MPDALQFLLEEISEHLREHVLCILAHLLEEWNGAMDNTSF